MAVYELHRSIIASKTTNNTETAAPLLSMTMNNIRIWVVSWPVLGADGMRMVVAKSSSRRNIPVNV
jgi:hypothetical protein